MKDRFLLVLGVLSMLLLPGFAVAQSGADEVQMTAEHPSGYSHRHKSSPRPHPGGRRAVRPGAMKSYVGIGAIGNYMVDTGEDLSRIYKGGGGLELVAGMTITPHLVGEISYFAAPQKTDPKLTGSSDATGIIMSAGLDMKIYMTSNDAPIAPFFQVGAGAYIFTEEFQEDLTGVGFRVGGGVDIALSPLMKFSLRALYHGFYMDNSDDQLGKVATESAYLNIITGSANIQFHF